MLLLRLLPAMMLTCCLAGCVLMPATKVIEPVPVASSVPTLLPPSPTAAATWTAIPTATALSTPTPTRIPTERPTRTPTATFTPIPSPVVLYDPLRRTPPTLMLHRSNPDFDAVAFLQDFVQILQEHQMHAVTYHDLTRLPDLTAAEHGRLMILTIDDISLQAPIDPSILQMIEILREAGYPAVLGIVTEGKLPDLETAATLKALAAEGWELAIHTENHVDLHVLEQTSSYGARLEIRTCAEKIFNATGVHADTLVLPYGSMVENMKILYRENVRWVVGIVGGEKYRTTHQVYYVGRDGPSGDAQQTYAMLMKRFNGD